MDFFYSLARVEVVQRGLDELERPVERVGVAAARVQDVHAEVDAPGREKKTRDGVKNLDENNIFLPRTANRSPQIVLYTT